MGGQFAKKTKNWLLRVYRGWKTSQLCEDYGKTLIRFLSPNQYEGFFVAHLGKVILLTSLRDDTIMELGSNHGIVFGSISMLKGDKELEYNYGNQMPYPFFPLKTFTSFWGPKNTPANCTDSKKLLPLEVQSLILRVKSILVIWLIDQWNLAKKVSRTFLYNFPRSTEKNYENDMASALVGSVELPKKRKEKKQTTQWFPSTNFLVWLVAGCWPPFVV